MNSKISNSKNTINSSSSILDTACFGADNPALLKLKQIDVSGQDMLIVTSDGIHDHVSIDEMEDIYCVADDKMVFCKRLIEQAVENGSIDDMSVVIGDRE